MSLYAFVCLLIRNYAFVCDSMHSYAILEDTPEKAFSRLALGLCLPDERPYLFHLPDCGAGAEFDGLWVFACFNPIPPCRGTYAKHMQHLGQPDKAQRKVNVPLYSSKEQSSLPMDCGSVMAAKCLLRFGVKAPRRSAAMSRSARPVAMA